MHTFFYNEGYEYDENDNLARISNDNGELTVIQYDTAGILPISETEYTFTYANGKIYPYIPEPGETYEGTSTAIPQPDTLITKTAKRKTDYTYNAYGQITVTNTSSLSAASGDLSSGKRIYTTTAYNTAAGSRIFGSVSRTVDSLGNISRHYYDSGSGRLLATVNEITGNGYAYTYDEIGRLKEVTPATYVISSSGYAAVTNAESVEYTYNANGYLSEIATESTTYTLSYDVFGNSSSVMAGDNTLASYEYNQKNGKLIKTTYGNGNEVSYVYDTLENIKEIWYNETKAYEYTYTDYGQVHTVRDNISNTETLYSYDTYQRLISITESSIGDSYTDAYISYYYDGLSRISSKTERIRYKTSALPKVH